ncbi:MAG: hypothetical protein OXC40_04835 [Proteobacteria bacterium]|nr:hypothetical protein [Pseudomonadota bacterium]
MKYFNLLTRVFMFALLGLCFSCGDSDTTTTSAEKKSADVTTGLYSGLCHDVYDSTENNRFDDLCLNQNSNVD